MRLQKSSFFYFSTHPHASQVDSPEDSTPIDRRKRLAVLCLMIFALAFTVRFFQWQDHHEIAVATHMAMNQYYLNDAKPLIRGNLREFLCGTDPDNDASPLAHPPGYALLIAASTALFGYHNLPLQFFQIFCDSLCAVLVFLIAVEFLPVGLGLLAGLIVAFSPQLGFYSLLLLPDSLVTLPLLIAVLLIIRAVKDSGVKKMIIAGAFIGLSCWIRPNGLLLAPFLSVLLFFLFKRGQRLLYSVILTGAAVLVISPITIRNYLVFHKFIPVSAGTGVTLIEGIADYDEENRFGLPKSDIEVQRQESQIYNRPEYALMLYSPDGIEREQQRLKRGLTVVRSHPLWFTTVMLKRVGFMLELQDATMPEFKVRPNPPAYRSFTVPEESRLVWSSSPANLVSNGIIARKTKVQVEDNGKYLNVVGDFFPFWTDHIVSAPIAVQPHTMYVVRVPFKLDTGRAILSVMRPDLQTEIAAVITPNPIVVRDTTNQPLQEVLLSFSSGDTNEVCLVLRDGAMGYQNLTARVGQIDMFAAGPAPIALSHYPRLITSSIQKVIMATWILPFVGIGICLLLLARQGRVVLLLLAVPAYYLCLQAPIHVEPRYILTVHYFFIILAVVPLYWLGRVVMENARRFGS